MGNWKLNTCSEVCVGGDGTVVVKEARKRSEVADDEKRITVWVFYSLNRIQSHQYNIQIQAHHTSTITHYILPIFSTPWLLMPLVVDHHHHHPLTIHVGGTLLLFKYILFLQIALLGWKVVVVNTPFPLTSFFCSSSDTSACLSNVASLFCPFLYFSSLFFTSTFCGNERVWWCDNCALSSNVFVVLGGVREVGVRY